LLLLTFLANEKMMLFLYDHLFKSHFGRVFF
jgi:hypothetical protein